LLILYAFMIMYPNNSYLFQWVTGFTCQNHAPDILTQYNYQFILRGEVTGKDIQSCR